MTLPRLLQAALAAVALIVPALAPAQEAYPSRPITLIVPFGPGSGTDIATRILAKNMSETLKVPVVVENKVGANGAIGAQAAAKARPDGYTLVIGSATTHAVNFAFFPGKLGYEPEQFQAVAGLSSSPVSLFVPAGSPWRRVSDLVAEAKRNPGKLSCGSGNAVTQVACEVFRLEHGIDAANVPYKSNPQSLNDVAGGQVSYAFSDASAALSLLEGKRLRAIGVAGPTRLTPAPDALTFREQGMPQFEFTAWVAVFAPTGVPAPVLERINAAVRKSSESAENTQMAARTGSTQMVFNVAESQAFYARELARWAKYVKDSGVKPEQ